MAEGVATVSGVRRAGRRVATLAVGVLVFAFSWLFRFNDPSGSYAGLTDDHFFYVVRGWQILFGDLPVRDFVDHGAPLHYYLAALVQQWLGRGTLSEVTFAVTVLSAAAALTFWLAARASGSILCGVAAALVHVLLQPRFYNYPKILVYTIAIPLLWRFADRPTASSRFWVAVVTALGFLFRHDHGAFVAVAFVALLVGLDRLPWRARLRHAGVYAALVLALLAPYLVFIEVHGGLDMYFRDAFEWAAHDRERAPLEWPPLFGDTGDNAVAWMFYLEMALPVFSLGTLALSRDGFRPDWPLAVPKLASVAVLGIALNAGFLRHPLDARLADPSVPHAILLAWLTATVVRAAASRRSFRDAVQPWAVAVRAAFVVAALSVAFVLWAALGTSLHDRLRKAALVGGPAEAIQRVRHIRKQLRDDWRLESWQHREDRPDLLGLSLYLNACTAPDDRIFIQLYAPQVLALARRAFAGGHADLRPGFFTSSEAQLLTVRRLRRQRVPVALLEIGDGYAGFRDSFPIIAAYFDEHYTAAGTHLFDTRFGVQLFARKDAHRAGTYDALGWPCFRSPDTTGSRADVD